MSGDEKPTTIVTNTASEEEILEIEDANVQQLEAHFLTAMELRQQGKTSEAQQHLFAIIREEPRLPEPHIELAHIYFSIDQLDDAKTHIELAVSHLENGGQWTEIPENEILSIAYVLQGEIYKGLADQDEVVFNDPDLFKELIELAKAAFAKANAIDPKNVEYSGSSHQWQWDQEIEGSINKAISESQENAHQPSDQSRHNSSDLPKH
jgi:tetratricopeptide (TPR) repeat protein